jgi:hypothetical protein
MDHAETIWRPTSKGVRNSRDVCTVIVRKMMKSRLIFDSAKSGLLLSEVPKRRLPRASGPRRLARPRTSPFHGGNTGSNPVGDAKIPKNLQFSCSFI